MFIIMIITTNYEKTVVFKLKFVTGFMGPVNSMLVTWNGLSKGL